MPPALLLLREISTTTTSLASLVEKSQKCQPLICYNLELTTPTKFDLIPQQQQQQQNDQKINDEGFESDIDTVSVISSDGSLVSATTTQETTQQPATTTTQNGETDSANGSSSSDSDADHLLTNDTSVHRYYPPPPTTTTTTTTTRNYYKESYNLVDCVCYSDIRVPDVLLFVIKQEVFVFKFENLLQLRDFYLNFTALKALTNQKTYNSNIYNSSNNNNVGTIDSNTKSGGKFNLLQRTDNNGVTHIEITREPELATRPPTLQPTNTNIISFNTPEIDYHHNLKRQSSDNLLKLAEISRNNNNNNSLRKVWNSADDLLGDSPKRPERRRRVKGRAPPPPIQQHQQQTAISDVLRGEYVRVNVNVDTNKHPNLIVKSQLKEKPKLTHFVTLLTKPKPSTTMRTTEQQLWTNSVPRLIKIKHNKCGPNSKLPPLRCGSESRHLPPMAYRYIDQSPTNTTTTTTNSISNRLFGLSSKLKDFHLESKMHSKWCSVGDVSIKNDTNLKSVIKKDDNRKKNDKKVTFSAYTTVQVV